MERYGAVGLSLPTKRSVSTCPSSRGGLVPRFPVSGHRAVLARRGNTNSGYVLRHNVVDERTKTARIRYNESV